MSVFDFKRPYVAESASTANANLQTYKSELSAADDNIYDADTAAQKVYSLNEVYNLMYAGSTSLVAGVITPGTDGAQLLRQTINNNVISYNYVITVSSPLELMRFSYFCAGLSDSRLVWDNPADGSNDVEIIRGFFTSANIRLGNNIRFDEQQIQFYNYSNATANPPSLSTTTLTATITDASSSTTMRSNSIGNAYGSFVVGYPFLPINGFGGVFDGQDFFIKGLKILEDDGIHNATTAAMFLSLSGTVKNFSLIEPEFITLNALDWQHSKTEVNARALVGSIDANGVLENVYALGVTAEDFSGIYVSKSDTGTVTDCYTYGTSSLVGTKPGAIPAASSTTGWITKSTGYVTSYIAATYPNASVRFGLQFSSSATAKQSAYLVSKPADLFAMSYAIYEMVSAYTYSNSNTVVSAFRFTADIDMRYIGAYSFLPALMQSAVEVMIYGGNKKIYNFSTNAYIYYTPDNRPTYAYGLVNAPLGATARFTAYDLEFKNYSCTLASVSSSSYSAAGTFAGFLGSGSGGSVAIFSGLKASGTIKVSDGALGNVGLGGFVGGLRNRNVLITNSYSMMNLIGGRIDAYPIATNADLVETQYTIGGFVGGQSVSTSNNRSKFIALVSSAAGGVIEGFNISRVGGGEGVTYSSYGGLVGAAHTGNFYVNGIYSEVDVTNAAESSKRDTSITTSKAVDIYVGGIAGRSGLMRQAAVTINNGGNIAVADATAVTADSVLVGAAADLVLNTDLTSIGVNDVIYYVSLGGIAGRGGIEIGSSTSAVTVSNIMQGNLTMNPSDVIRKVLFGVGNIIGCINAVSTFDYVTNDKAVNVEYSSHMGNNSVQAQYTSGVGGLAGSSVGTNSNYSATFTNCSNTVEISATPRFTDKATVIINVAVSGLYGYVNAINTATFTSCTNSGKVLLKDPISEFTSSKEAQLASIVLSGIASAGTFTACSNSGEVGMSLTKTGAAENVSSYRLDRFIASGITYAGSMQGTENVGMASSKVFLDNASGIPLGQQGDNNNFIHNALSGVAYSTSDTAVLKSHGTVSLTNDKSAVDTLHSFSISGIGTYGNLNASSFDGKITVNGGYTSVKATPTSPTANHNIRISGLSNGSSGLSNSGNRSNISNSSFSGSINFENSAYDGSDTTASAVMIAGITLNGNASGCTLAKNSSVNVKNARTAAFGGIIGTNTSIADNCENRMTNTAVFSGIITNLYYGGVSAFSANVTNSRNFTPFTLGIDNSKVTVTNLYVGGVMGVSTTPSAENAIKQVCNYGDISVTGAQNTSLCRVGGVVGSSYVPNNNTPNRMFGLVNEGSISLIGAAGMAFSTSSIQHSVGGVVGGLSVNNNDRKIYLCNSYNNGSVTAVGNFPAGGILGAANYNGNTYAMLDSCYNLGTVTASTTAAEIGTSVKNIGAAAGGIVGGLVGGGNSDSVVTSIDNCVNGYANITGYYAGGIVGAQYDTNNIDSQNNVKSALSYGTVTGVYAGGIVGAVSSRAGRIVIMGAASYATVNGSTAGGGIVGGVTSKDSTYLDINDAVSYATFTGAGTNFGLVGSSEIDVTARFCAYVYVSNASVTAAGGSFLTDTDIITGTNSLYTNVNTSIHYTNEAEYYAKNDRYYKVSTHGAKNTYYAPTLVWSEKPAQTTFKDLTDTYCYAVTDTYGRALGSYVGDNYRLDYIKPALNDSAKLDAITKKLTVLSQITESRDGAIDASYYNGYVLQGQVNVNGSNLGSLSDLPTAARVENSNNTFTVTFNKTAPFISAYISNGDTVIFNGNSTQISGEFGKYPAAPPDTCFAYSVTHAAEFHSMNTTVNTHIATLKVYSWQGEAGDYETNKNDAEWCQKYLNEYTFYVVYLATGAELSVVNDPQKNKATTLETLPKTNVTTSASALSGVTYTQTPLYVKSQAEGTYNYYVTSNADAAVGAAATQTFTMPWIYSNIQLTFLLNNTEQLYAKENLTYDFYKVNSDGSLTSMLPNVHTGTTSPGMFEYTASFSNFINTSEDLVIGDITIPVVNRSGNFVFNLSLTDYIKYNEIASGTYRLSVTFEGRTVNVDLEKGKSGDFFMHYATSGYNNALATSGKQNYTVLTSTLNNPLEVTGSLGNLGSYHFANLGNGGSWTVSGNSYSWNGFYTRKANNQDYGRILALSALGETKDNPFGIFSASTSSFVQIYKAGNYADAELLSYEITPDYLNNGNLYQFATTVRYKITAEDGSVANYSVSIRCNELPNFSRTVSQNGTTVDEGDIDRREQNNTVITINTTEDSNMADFVTANLTLEYCLTAVDGTYETAATYDGSGNQLSNNNLVPELPTVAVSGGTATFTFSPETVGGYYKIKQTYSITGLEFVNGIIKPSEYGFTVTPLASATALGTVVNAALDVIVIKNAGRDAYLYNISFTGTLPTGADIWGYEKINESGIEEYRYVGIGNLFSDEENTTPGSIAMRVNYGNKYVAPTDPNYFTDARISLFRIQLRFTDLALENSSYMKVRFKGESTYGATETHYNDEMNTMYRLNLVNGVWVQGEQVKIAHTENLEDGAVSYVDLNDVFIAEGEVSRFRVYAQNTAYYTDYEFMTTGPLRNKTFKFEIDHSSVVTSGMPYFISSRLMTAAGTVSRSSTVLYSTTTPDTPEATLISSRNASGRYTMHIASLEYGVSLTVTSVTCAEEQGAVVSWSSSGFEISSDNALTIVVRLCINSIAELPWGDIVYG